jgi:thiol-disulfide isomerase/thioredoxin
MTGIFVVAAAVVLSVAFGIYRAVTDGRVRRTRPAESVARFDEGRLGEPLGSEATFVQFSSAVCAPCRATHRVLSGITADVDSLAHVEIDAESRLDLVKEFNISRTPTVLLLDADGVVRHRIVGAPRKPDVVLALQEVASRPAA